MLSPTTVSESAGDRSGTVAAAVPGTCPRCQKPLVRNHDELVCMVHGTIVTPVRAWDGVSERAVDMPAGRERNKKPHHSAPLTDYDRRILAGDVPAAALGLDEADEPAQMRRPVVMSAAPAPASPTSPLGTIETVIRERLKELEDGLEEAKAAIHARQEEALKLRKALVALGGPISAAPRAERWMCPGCGWVGSSHNPGRHTARCAKWQAMRTEAAS